MRRRCRTARWRYGRSPVIRPRRPARTAGRSRPAGMTRCWPDRGMSAGAVTRWRCGGSSAAGNAMSRAVRVRRSPSGCRRYRRGTGSRALREHRDRGHRRGITPAEAARHAGISWPVAHEAFAAAADPVLDQAPAPVAHLGIDEHRRAGPGGRWTMSIPGNISCSPTGGTPASLTCPAEQGLLGQVEGRTADDAAYWLAQAAPPGGTRSGSSRSTCAHLRLRGAPDAARRADRRGLIPRRPPSRQDDRRRAPPGSPRQSTGGADGPATPSTASRTCWSVTWSTCHPPSSPR